MRTKIKIAACVISVLTIAILWAEMPRIKLLREIDSALEEGAASNREIVSTTRKQAEAGDPQAQFNLAILYENGLRDALPKDQSQALAWYDRAAAQGHTEARRVLDGYVKSGLISAPYFHGQWAPLAQSDAANETAAASPK